jgi:hypothetical protein
MAIRVRVQNGSQIIVPVRVDRAVRGAPELDAPDVDDRGWINNRAAGLNVDDARGALFGATVGDTVRLRVVREDLDDAVPLFVTATGGQVEIAQPAVGGPLAADGIFSVRAVADTTAGTKVQVRLGSVSGSIICEADAHVFTPSTLNITPHICTIHHSPTAATGAGVSPSVNGNTMDDDVIDDILDIVRAVWRPSGVQFNVASALPETYVGFLRDDFASQNRPGVGSEENLVIRQNQQPGTCNVYFLRFMDRSLGVGVRVENRAAENLTRSGILIGVEGSSGDAAGTVINLRTSAGADLVHEIGNDLAHEIGHFLTLVHAGNVDAPGLSDTYARRQLMHPVNLLPAAVTPATANSVPRFDDIGYGVVGGAGHRGCLVTLKDHPKHSTDGEVIPARRRFSSPNLFR